MVRWVVVVMACFVVVGPFALADDDKSSERASLISSIDDKVHNIASELSGFDTQRDYGNADDALSYARDVADLISKLKDIQGSDSRANAIVSNYPNYLDTFRESTKYLKKLKEILGMQCVYDGSLAGSPERLARLADLVADPRWFYRFKLVQPATIPQMPDAPRFPGQVGAGRLRDAAREALSSPSTDSVLFSMSKKEVGDHADFNVPTGRRVIYESASTYSANAKWRLPEAPDPEAAAAAWVELQHAIVATLGAMHGVIVTGTNAWSYRPRSG